MTELTDQNFEEIIQKSEKPILVDFWATWCGPCFVLSPILEKLEEEYRGKIIFAKVNVDVCPQTSLKFEINKIPTVVFFKNGKSVGGFMGVQPEPAIKNWLDENLKKEKEEKEEDMEKLIKECEDYAKQKGLRLNPNEEIVERIIRGLLKNEKKYGKRYCPCRRVTGDPEKDDKIVCPCAYHLDEIERDGKCFCQLFVK